MPGFIGVPELLLLGLVALLLFGPKRLPEMGRGLGKGMREFKDSVTGKDKDELPEGSPDKPEPTTVTPASMARVSNRSFSVRRACASCTRLLIPAISR